MPTFQRCLIAAGLAAAIGSSTAASREPEYVTSTGCAECHADAYDAWADSHHGWAWRPAEAANILADFADATFAHRGVSSRFSTRGDRYFVETAGPDGQQTTYEIAGTVGVTPLQQYLVDIGDGRLQALDIVWDTEQERWYHLYPDQVLGNDPGMHWTGPYRNWNSRCVSCHVTGFVKGYEPQDDVYQSTWSEMGVGCEACHGPGEAHIAWAKQPGPASLRSFDGVDDFGLTVSFPDDDPQATLDVCATCHSRRESLGADSPSPGEPFDDHYRLALLREDLYHPDGQIDDEVYVYGSFLQSKMHARGVSCNDCHQPHSAKLVAEGDAVCTQCHNPQGYQGSSPDETHERFPTLKKASYISPLHHRHRSGTESSQCVSCHMPDKTYMGVDPRRDHSFRVPRPDLTAEIGTPNACNGCHTDQTAGWASEQVVEWFPHGHHLRPHFGKALHAARQGLNKDTAAGLLDLAMDTGQPAIARASALEMLSQVPSMPELAGPALPLLADESPLVRSTVLGLFDGAPQQARAEHAGPLLKDPVRTVRIAAARRILDIDTGHLSESDRAIVEDAVGEYQASLAAQADFPEVQLNLARFAETLGKQRLARRSLETAIRLDPKLAEGWLRLARLDIDAGRFDSAQQTLERAVVETPGAGALHQLLGRVLAQTGHQSAAAEAFQKAVKLLPEGLEVRVEYVSLLTNLGEHGKALQALAETDGAARSDPQVLYLLAYNHAQTGDVTNARLFAQELSSRHPQHSLNENLRSVLKSI